MNPDCHHIFSCALSALINCVTRFDGYSVRDLFERTFQAELYSELRDKYGFDNVEFETPYPNSSNLCDIVLYQEDSEYWIEIKFWSTDTSLVKSDITKMKKLLPSNFESNSDKHLILLTFWGEDEKPIECNKFSQLIGTDDLNMENKKTWFAIFPAPKSNKFPSKYACCSMYLI